MLGNINNSTDYLGRQSVEDNSSLSQISAKKNIGEKYAQNNVYFEDKTNISNEAIELLEKERDIQKFTKEVMQAFDENEVNAEVASLLSSGAYEVDDEDLVDSLFEDGKLMEHLFS